MKKLEFVDLKYKSDKKDLVCLFRISPGSGLSVKEAANVEIGRASCRERV